MTQTITYAWCVSSLLAPSVLIWWVIASRRRHFLPECGANRVTVGLCLLLGFGVNVLLCAGLATLNISVAGYAVYIMSAALPLVILSNARILQRALIKHVSVRGLLKFRNLSIVLVLTYFSLYAFLALNSPVFGWDAVDIWVPYGLDFFGNLKNLTDDHSGALYSRHPPTVPYFIGWVTYVADAFNVTATPVLNFCWLLVGVAIFCLLSGYAIFHGIDSTIANLLGVITLSIPLLENHFLISGYADIILAAYILALFVVIDLVGRFRPFPIFLVLVLLLAPSVIKNTGYLYSLIIAVLILLNLFKLSISRITLCFALGICVAVASSKSDTAVFTAGGSSISYAHPEIVITFAECEEASAGTYIYIHSVPSDPEVLSKIASKYSLVKFPGQDVRRLDIMRKLEKNPDGRCLVRVEMGDYQKENIRIRYVNEEQKLIWAAELLPGTTVNNFFGGRVSLQNSDQVVLGIFGRFFSASWQPVTVVVDAAMTALISNSSFSVLLLILCLTSWSALGTGSGPNTMGFKLSVQFCWISLITLTVSQLFSHEILRFAQAGADTRYSRFLTVIAPAAMVAVVGAVSAVGRTTHWWRGPDKTVSYNAH